METFYNAVMSEAGDFQVETYSIESLVFADKLASAIDDIRAVDTVSATQWDRVVEFSRGLDSKEAWLERVAQAEDNNISTRIQAGEEFLHYSRDEEKFLQVVSMRTSKGKIIAKRAFGNTWTDYKAVIGKALDLGVDLFDADGNVKPKTALHTEYSEKDKEEKPEKTEADKMQAVLHTYKSIYAKLSKEERADCRKLIENIHENMEVATW